MKCPLCVQQGKRSVLRLPGGGMSTLMCSHSYYDEDGNYHHHDPNICSQTGRCSNGHIVRMRYGNRCAAPGCTYGNDATVTAKEPQPTAKEGS